MRGDSRTIIITYKYGRAFDTIKWSYKLPDIRTVSINIFRSCFFCPIIDHVASVVSSEIFLLEKTVFVHFFSDPQESALGGFYGNKILYKNRDLTQDSLNKILFHSRAVIPVFMVTKSCTKILILPKILPTRFRIAFYGNKILYKTLQRFFADGRKCALFAKP